MTVSQMLTALKNELDNSSAQRKGDVAAAATELRNAANLTSPDFSGYTNSGTTDPPVPPLKEIPSTDPLEVQICKIKAGIQMLRCYLNDPQDAADCEETYCEAFPACEDQPV